MMQVGGALSNTAVRALARSMDVHTMVVLARRLLDRYYDLHERTGFQRSIPIPNLDAARQIVDDVKTNGKFLELVNLLIEIREQGLTGRRYAVPHLRELVRGIHELGFDYDQETRMFVEDPRVRKTPNWGVLHEGERYAFAFLRLDVVGNSTLVRRFPRKRVEQAYGDLATLVRWSVERYNGRLWSWEGDGGLAAFFFSNRNSLATLAAIGVIHELFLYNRLSRPLSVPLQVRMAVHAGTAEYTSNAEEIHKSDAVRQTIQIEGKLTKPNTLTVSNAIYSTLEPRVARQLRQMGGGYYRYELVWEK